MEKLLREVCETLEVSRRAVQGYEKAGLVSATGHNERGYLLYDEEAQKRIEKCKMYQEMGFKVKEIVQVIDAPEDILKSALEEKLDEMQRRKEKLDESIKRADELIKALLFV